MLVSLLLDLGYVVVGVLVGLPYLLIRRLRGKRSAPLLRRLGRVQPVTGPEPRIWLHAVSVGEVLAARGLVTRLRAAWPDATLVISGTTAAGLEMARRTYPTLAVRESPLDLSFAVGSFLGKVRPAMLVLVELELWPNLLRVCRRRGVPVVVVNGKISERSARGYGRLSRLIPGFPAAGVMRFLVQEPVYAMRLAELGVPDSKIEVAGNLKFDNIAVEDPEEQRRCLRATHGFPSEALVLVAGSTHPGEDALLLDALGRLHERGRRLRLVLAPRHPERVPELEALCRREALRTTLRSAARPDDPDVLLVDTLGELHNLYALADLAFVGGTLVPVGGHNLLEPASLGLPLVVGPHLDTVREMAALLAQAGVLTVLSAGDHESITETLLKLLEDPDAKRRAADGAARVIAAHRGAVECAASAIADVLGRKLPKS